MVKLADVAVRNAKPKPKPYKLGDRGNLHLLLTPAGGKLWRWSYRYEGKQKLMTFGRYPDVSLGLARDRLGTARKLLAAGLDPMEERQTDKKAKRTSSHNFFSTVAQKWLEHWQDGKSPRHVDSTARRLVTNVFPALGSRPIAEIEAPELVAMVKEIEKRGARDIAKRALETTGQISRYAIAHGYARRNPASEIRPRDVLRAGKRENYARVSSRELGALLQQIEVYQGTHVTRLAMKLMALTFVRTTELIQAKWTEFDIKNARWDIPAERMKMRTPHIVPSLAKLLRFCKV